MSKILYFIFIVFPIFVFAFTDLGKWGGIYEIREKISFKDANLSLLSHKNVQKTFKKAITSRIKLPSCQKSRKRVVNFNRVLDHDINMPKYGIFISKGTEFNPLKHAKINKYMLMIDSSDANQTALAQHYANSSMIIVYNGSILPVTNGNLIQEVYIADKDFQNAFKVKCLPSFYIQEKDKMFVQEISMKDLISKKKEK